MAPQGAGQHRDSGAVLSDPRCSPTDSTRTVWRRLLASELDKNTPPRIAFFSIFAGVLNNFATTAGEEAIDGAIKQWDNLIKDFRVEHCGFPLDTLRNVIRQLRLKLFKKPFAGYEGFSLFNALSNGRANCFAQLCGVCAVYQDHPELCISSVEPGEAMITNSNPL